MTMIDCGGVGLNVELGGDPGGRPLVLAHGLGLDLTIWDAMLRHLPAGLRTVRYDLRGHGLSGVPAPPYGMGALVRDAERMMDALSLRNAVFVGLSIGGMVAQGLAFKRPDLVQAVVLAGCAAKIGTAQTWQARIAMARSGGMEAMIPEVLSRWFPKVEPDNPEIQKILQIVKKTAVDGYAGCCAALAGADFIAPTSALRLPALVIAGTGDAVTPPDMARELADLIPASHLSLVRGAGHLVPVDRPADVARQIADFVARLPAACGSCAWRADGHRHGAHDHG